MMDQMLSLLLPALPGVLILLLVLPIAVKRRRRALADRPLLVAVGPVDALGEPVVAESAVDHADEGTGEADESDESEEPVHVRALRQQVRTLCAALESEEARAERRHAALPPQDIEDYRRRVDATIQAMSRRTVAGEAPELVEARMLAAVDRLEGPLGFARPALSPASPHGSLGLLEPTPLDAPVVEEQPAEPVDDEAYPQPELVLVPAGAPEPEAPEVVLPVPLMASSTTTRRRRLRLRDKAS